LTSLFEERVEVKEEDYSVPDNGSAGRSNLKLRAGTKKSWRIAVDIQNQSKYHINETFIDES